MREYRAVKFAIFIYNLFMIANNPEILNVLSKMNSSMTWEKHLLIKVLQDQIIPAIKKFQ